MIGAEEARRASSRRGGGEGGRRGGVGDKNNLKEACVRVVCVCESDKKRSFFLVSRQQHLRWGKSPEQREEAYSI